MSTRKHKLSVKGSERSGPVIKAAGAMIRCVICEPGERAREARIEATERAIAEAVGGDPARFWTYLGCWLYFNKRAVDLNLPWNVLWKDPEVEVPHAGTLLLLGSDVPCGEVCGLTLDCAGDIIYALNKLTRKLPPTPSIRDEQLMWLGLDPEFLPGLRGHR